MRTLICLLASIAVSAQTPSGGAAKAPAAKISAAEIIKRVEPEYSPKARAANYEGTLTVYVEVDTSGKPANVQIIQGLGLGLDEKAVEAVKQWEFKTAELNGKPLQTAQGIEIRFRLDPVGGWRVRHTGYTVTRNDKYDAILEKPVLTQFARPDPSACAGLGGSLVGVQFSIDKKGVPYKNPNRPAAHGCH